MSLIPASQTFSPTVLATDLPADKTAFADIVMSIMPAVPQGPDLPAAMEMAGLNYAHMIVIFGYALTVATIVPGLKQRSETFRTYSALAASAMSRIRCTIARKPLDLCADRC